MPLILNSPRFACILFAIASALIASGIAVGQGNGWSPYRDTDVSKEQAARRVQEKQVRIPPPIRLAQYQKAQIRPIQAAPIKSAESLDRLDEFGAEESLMGSSDGNGNNHQASHPMLIPDPIDGFNPDSQAHSPAHAVIRSPAMQAKLSKRRSSSVLNSGTGFSSGAHHSGIHEDEAGGGFTNSEDERLPAPPIHGQYSKLAKKNWLPGPIQPRQATIPGGRERATWKQPYSYGYFGSKSKRHWGTHHGYRDRYTEYRYR